LFIFAGIGRIGFYGKEGQGEGWTDGALWRGAECCVWRAGTGDYGGNFVVCDALRGAVVFVVLLYGRCRPKSGRKCVAYGVVVVYAVGGQLGWCTRGTAVRSDDKRVVWCIVSVVAVFCGFVRGEVVRGGGNIAAEAVCVERVVAAMGVGVFRLCAD